MSGLNEKQMEYCRLVNSGMDPEQAILAAGYKPSGLKDALRRMSKNPAIMECLNIMKRGDMPDGNRSDECDAVANREDREGFWTKMMNDPNNSGAIRLEASKLLGKAQGDFIDKHKLNKRQPKAPVIVIPSLTPEQWEDYWEKSTDEQENT